MSFSALSVGSVVAPCAVAAHKEEERIFWLEIELVGEDDEAVPWEEYLVELPDGTAVRGYLDQDGFARLDRLSQSGNCRISFPNLDQDAWDTVSALPMKEQDSNGG